MPSIDGQIEPRWGHTSTYVGIQMIIAFGKIYTENKRPTTWPALQNHSQNYVQKVIAYFR